MFKKHFIDSNSTWYQKIHYSLIYGKLHHFFMGMILLYAALLTLSLSVKSVGYPEIALIDTMFTGLFVLELMLKILVSPTRFYKYRWNLIDSIILIASLFIPGAKALRILRLFIYIYTFIDHHVINRIIHSFMRSLPTLIISTMVLASVIFSYGLLTTSIFGEKFPALFGNIGRSVFVLFQLMTLDGWTDDIVRPVMMVYPWSPLIFISFIVLTAYGLTNIFVGAIVNAMNFVDESKKKEPSMTDLQKQIKELKDLILKEHYEKPKKD